MLLEGKTDAEGNFSFTPSKKEKMTIVLILDGGHRTEFVLEKDEFSEKETPTPVPTTK